jgi:cell division protein FtsL
MEALEEKTKRLERKVGQVTKLLITTTVTFVIALATGLLNLLIN